MFVYQNNEHTKVFLNTSVDHPSDNPDYTFEVADGKVYVNDTLVAPVEVLEVEGATMYETSYEITAPAYVDTTGCTIKASPASDNDSNGVYYVTENGILTITGNGTIDATNDTHYAMAVFADRGKVIINNGIFTNENQSGDDPQYDLIYVKNGGYIEINGGEFKSKTPRWTLNSHNTHQGTIIVKGGRFYQYDPSASKTDENGAELTNFVADGYKVTQDGEWFIVSKA